MKITYDPKLKERAKKLRNNSTLAEVLLWGKLKNRQVRGQKFIRQKPINKYIVDFFCNKLRLVIEIDGITHFDQEERDEKRQSELEKLGLRFLRFGDSQIKNNLNGVVMEIEDWIDNN